MDQPNDVVAYRLGMLHIVALFEKKRTKNGRPDILLQSSSRRFFVPTI